MRVGAPSQRSVINYGCAVAAVPLSSGGFATTVPVVTQVDALHQRNVRTAASSDLGRSLDLVWDGYTSELASVLDRLAVLDATSAELHSWFETPDVAYPAPRVLEVLDVEIVENSSADPFRFTDTDFDAWV